MAKKISERFCRRRRIIRSSDYRAIYSTGRKARSQGFVLFGRENKLGYHRLGITVTRKVGSAVIRNHIKRLFREIFRRFSAEIPGQLDLLVNAKPGCAKIDYSDLRREFISAAKRICR